MKFPLSFLRTGFVYLFILAFNLALNAQSLSYSDSLNQARTDKNEELKSKKTSPLLKVDRKAFHDLEYFPVDETWNIEAHYHRIYEGEVLDFMTSKGSIKKFQKYGYFVFTHDEIHDTLYAYKRVYPDGYVPNYPPYLFIPFKDHTSGNETYGGGRYIDTKVFETDQVVMLDFNTCYSPYCAYGGGFSCPIPPEENFVNGRVEAGEKAYAGH